MSPRRGGTFGFDGLSGAGASSGGDGEYGSQPNPSTTTACSQPGIPSWWNISYIVITALFLVIYILIAFWYITFLFKGGKIKGVPLLLRFRFSACLFCLILYCSFRFLPLALNDDLKGGPADLYKFHLLSSDLHGGTYLR